MSVSESGRYEGYPTDDRQGMHTTLRYDAAVCAEELGEPVVMRVEP